LKSECAGKINPPNLPTQVISPSAKISIASASFSSSCSRAMWCTRLHIRFVWHAPVCVCETGLVTRERHDWRTRNSFFCGSWLAHRIEVLSLSGPGQFNCLRTAVCAVSYGHHTANSPNCDRRKRDLKSARALGYESRTTGRRTPRCRRKISAGNYAGNG